MLLETLNYLGPAQVLAAAGPHLRLSVSGQEVEATLALAYPYQPAVGDLVLAIGQEETFYVIGILRGRGKTRFTAPGDLELRAPSGAISLVSAKGIRMRSRAVSIRARKLDIVAEAVLEKFTEAVRWIRKSLHVRAGSVRQVVEEKYSVKAERIEEYAEKDVKIDGEKIHLG